MNRGFTSTGARTEPPRVKICCIADPGEAALAVRFGASAIGLVSAMPSGPGVIPESRIREIAATVPPGVATFLLTAETRADAIVRQQRFTGATTLQLVDRVPIDQLSRLREVLDGVSLVQVIHVTGPASAEEAAIAAPRVDALLLDSGDPDRAIKELGGTGRTHDWSVSRSIVDTVGCPVYLAGGLHSGNVRAALDQVSPFGLDVCSGVRSEGRLDRQKLSAFMRAAGLVAPDEDGASSHGAGDPRPA